MTLPDPRPLLMFAALLVALPASAQYVWLDDNGRKQYSDMPPPVSVPLDRILKQPGVRSPSPDPTSTSAEPPSGANQAPPPTLAEREADYRKRRAEREEKEKKDAEEARIAAEKKENCARWREYQKSLESGERLARRDAKGERQYLSDEDRARELAETKRALATCK